MSPTHQQIKEELDTLIQTGQTKLLDAATAGRILESQRPSLIQRYQPWYTKALYAVQQLLPERSDEFRRLYSTPSAQRKSIERENFTIADYLQGIILFEGAFDPRDISTTQFATLLRTQLAIVQSARERLDSLLANLTDLLQAQLFDDELSAAAHLRENGHLRAAGVVAGVVLESHLRQVVNNHSVIIPKKDPSISNYNDALKSANVIDIADWRFIQRLGDIRNICGHQKDREPTDQEVKDIIDGTDRIVKMVL